MSDHAIHELCTTALAIAQVFGGALGTFCLVCLFIGWPWRRG